ncbi:MAG: ATP-binding protein [Deltaproteobacteria bacterium]|nr:ATP-binding protein [Deltaproteobacteria bacterium]
MAELDAVIAEIRLLAEAALLRRLNAGSGFADPRVPSQIYLRDEAALARLAGGTLRPQKTHTKAAAELAAQLAKSGARSPRLETLIERLGMDPAGRIVLAIAIAYAIDLDTRELCHALVTRHKPALYLETCADLVSPTQSSVLLQALLPGSPLRRARVLAVDGEGLGATIDLVSAALAWLLGDDRLQMPLSNVATLIAPDADLGVVLPEAAKTELDALTPRLVATSHVAAVIRGPRGSGRQAAAHRIAKTLGRPLMVIPIPALLALESRAKTALFAAALAAARLRDAVPYLADAEPLFDDQGHLAAEHADAIAHHPGALIAGTTRSKDLELLRPVLSVLLPRAELDDRERAWVAALASHGTHVGDEAAELAARYVIGPGAIADVAADAGRYAVAAGISVDVPTLEAAVGRRLTLRLGTFGTVVTRKSRFTELVLPDEVIDTLRDMIAMVRERSQILERWGYQRHLGISRGVSGLYSGEPGTGKTMAASVVASELGLELVRIDLSAVVSKYVGETEKNLGKIFDEAQDAHAMLLFDEADSLFGKRTKLESAQDRFANLEVNYILQRMETFDGVSVLTTNAEASIDPALQRRLNFRIRFPEPEPDERAKLWRQLLPPSSGLHERVDFYALAERFDMTGGYIKNAVVRAAVIAARAGRSMVAEDLWLGAHHEYVEMGKVMPQPSGSL